MNNSRYAVGHKCPECNGQLTEQKDLLLVSGKTFTKKIMQCAECNETYSNLDELGRLKKLIRPSLLSQIKNFFNKPDQIEELNLFKRKIL